MAAYPDDPLIVAPDATVSEVLQLMRIQQTGSVLVCEAGKMLGIFTDRDALRWMAKQTDEANRDSDSQPISELMTREPTSLLATTSVGEAIQLMSAGRYRHLPIIATGGLPSGMGNVHGIVHYLVDHFPQTIYTLPPHQDMAQAEREGA